MTDVPDDLLDAQERVGRAIDQARAGEDKQLSQQVRETGEQVVRLLNGLQRLTRIHDPRNSAFDAPLHELAVALARLSALLGEVRVVCVEGQVYVNDIRIRLDEKTSSAAELTEELARHGSGGLTFSEPIPAEGLRILTFLLAGDAPPAEPRARLMEALAAEGLATVAPTGFYRLKYSGEEAPIQADGTLRKSLLRASASAADAWAHIAAGRLPNPAPMRRVVAEIVDASESLDVIAEEADLADEATSTFAIHSRRVCVLAVVLGRALGLHQASLADLGVAAMFHDAGYAARIDGASPDFQRHPMATLRVLLRQRGFHTAKLRRQLAGADHHRPYDRPASLYGRILHICDDFDTLTRGRPLRGLHTPADALRRMASASGTLYDPVILQVFVNLLGRYPAGTPVRLADGRMGVSVSGARDPARWALPLVSILEEADGTAVAAAYVVDTALEVAVAGEAETR